MRLSPGPCGIDWCEQEFPGDGYDLVAFFDCLHDLGDPVGAMTHILETLSDAGALLIVEPTAGDFMEENLQPIGRVYIVEQSLSGQIAARRRPSVTSQSADIRCAGAQTLRP